MACFRLATLMRQMPVWCAAGLLLALAASTPASSSSWPTRTVRFVVPYGAGGLADVHARLIADRMSAIFGQPFVIENRPGAGGTTAIEAVLRMPADGYTFLYLAGFHYSVLPLMNKVSYDPIKQLQPVAIVARWGNVLAVHKDSPINSFKDFVDYAKANPGKIDYSSAGVGGANHLVGIAVANHAKLDMLNIVFGSSPASLSAVMAKSVHAHFGNSSDMIAPVQGGLIKALAVTSPKRMPQIPNVPTMAEEVLPGFEFTSWSAIVAAADTPKDIVARAAEALEKIANDPEVSKKLYTLGIEAVAIKSDAVNTIIQKDLPFFTKLIDSAGLRHKDNVGK